MPNIDGNEESRYFSDLHGDLQSMGLTEIFETLGAKHQYGWLSIENEEQQVILYFQGDRVGLTTPPEHKFFYIPAKLYYAGKLSQEQYQSIIESDDLFRDLEEQVDEEILTTLLDTIYYDEICSLFSWQSGYFEFMEQQEIPESERPGFVSKLFDAEGILMEAARRLDEIQEIERILPAKEEIIFATTEVTIPDLEDPVGNILNLSYFRSVEDVILFSYLSEFDASKILASLYESGQVSQMSDEGLKDHAERLESEGKVEEAKEYYNLLRDRTSSLHPSIFESLVSFYEREQDNASLAQLYQDKYEELLQSTSSEDVVQGAHYLKKYSDLLHETREGLEARLYLLDITISHHLENKIADYDPISDGKWLFAVLRRQKEDEKARHVLQTLLQIDSYNKSLRGELINIHLDLGDTESAIAEYETLAKAYERDNEWEELKSTYQKILRLDPSRKNILSKLEKVELRQKRAKSFMAKLIALVVVLLLAAGGFYYYQYRSLEQEKGNELLEQARQQLLRGNFEQARKILDNLKETQSDLPLAKELSRLEQDYQKLLSRQDEDINQLLAKAKEHKKQGELKQAIAILEQALGKHLITQDKKQEILALKNDISKSLQDFQQRLERAQQLEKRGKLQNATLIYKDLWHSETYQHLAQRKGIRYPIEMKISPAQARVEVDGQVVSGKDNIYHLAPDFSKIEIHSPGYKSYYFYNAFAKWNPQQQTTDDGKTLYPLQEAEVRVNLTKDFLWKFQLQGVVESAPLVVNKQLYVACRDDYVYCFDLSSSDKKLQWSSKPDFLTSFNSTPAYSGDTLYIGGNNATFYALDRNNQGAVLARYKLADSALIESTPEVAQEEKLVLFSSDNGSIYALPLVDSKTFRWQYAWRLNLRASQPKIKSALKIYGKYVLVVSSNGFFLILDLKTGKILFKRSFRKEGGSQEIWPPSVFQNRVYVGGDENLQVISLAHQGKTRLRFPISGTVYASPFVNNKGIFFTEATAEGNGKVYHISHRNLPEENWTFASENPFQSGAIVSSKGVTYAGDTQGVVYSLDMQGKKRWQYATGEEILSSPVIAAEKQLLVVAGKTLYSFLID